jgi:hypothetical protein
MKKLLFTFSFLILLMSCEEKEKKPVENLTLEQIRLREKHIERANAKYKAPNDIRKNEIDEEYEKWINSYFKDTLNNKINGFKVKVSKIDNGAFQDIFYIRADMSDEIGFKYYQEENFSTENEMKKSELLTKISNVTEKSNALLYGTFERFDLYASDPTIYIKIDSIK